MGGHASHFQIYIYLHQLLKYFQNVLKINYEKIPIYNKYYFSLRSILKIINQTIHTYFLIYDHKKKITHYTQIYSTH